MSGERGTNRQGFTLGSPYLRGLSGVDLTREGRRRHTGKGTLDANREHGLDLPAVVACAHCDWRVETTVREGRELFKIHRRETHL